MRSLLFFIVLVFTSLTANDFNTSDNNNTDETNTSVKVTHAQKVLYLNYEDIPKRVLKGEIFPITIKTLSIIKDFTDITYRFSNGVGLKLLNTIPKRESDEKYYYDTFYFLTTKSKVKLPSITASLETDEHIPYKTTTLNPKKLNVITLNPKKDFSNIIADDFSLTHYKTTTYDDKHNIILFIAQIQNSDVEALKFNNLFKQGFESVEGDFSNSEITYYMVIDKIIEKFSFSYFNLTKNKYVQINIPIIVDDEGVATQSDLKPKDQSRERLKMFIATGVAFVGFIFILWRKKYIYLIFILLPLIYIAYIAMPSKKLCIKKGTQIHLLPVKNGTIFETTQNIIYLQKEGKVKDFFKVKLQNEKIGWVKNEDICSY